MNYKDMVLEVLGRTKNGRGSTFKEIVLSVEDDVNLNSIGRSLQGLVKSGHIEKKVVMVQVYKLK